MENLLTWSRAQKGQITMNPKHLNVRTIAAGTTALLTGTEAKKSIRIINEISENLAINADKNMFTTVVRNTVSNAIKFTPQRGQIILRAEPAGDFVLVSVTDTGVGIPDTMKDKLFDIKINTAASGTHGEKGTGFGLVLCKDFVEKHGGSIWVESKEHQGTTVYFTLPVSGLP